MKDDPEFEGQALGGMFVIDEKGAKELEAIEEQFKARIREIEAESKRRSGESGEPTKPYLVGIYRRHDRPNMN